MAYSDPQTLGGVDHTRVYTGEAFGKFVSPNLASELIVDPRGTRKRRRNAARFYVRQNVTVGDVTTTEQLMVSITVDRPITGITDATASATIDQLVTWLTASSKANQLKLVAGEN